MTKHDGLDEIVADFVGRLRAVIRQQALDAVRDSLGVPGSTRTKRAATNRKGQKRDPAELDALQSRLQAFIAKTPGLRIEEINKQLGTGKGELALPIRKLLADKSIKTKGSKRATKYFAA
jgi:hypothetical protein